MAQSSVKTLLDELSILLALYKDYIGIQNDGKHFDINRISETVIGQLLTHLGGWGEMEVLDSKKSNHIAIDLKSVDGKVGVQVTSDKSADKVVDTLKKFNGLKPRPKSLYILMLRGRQKEYGSKEVLAAVGASLVTFNLKQHIVDIDYLYQLASQGQQADHIESANTVLKQAIGTWAFDILARHRSAAGRLLEVCDEHELAATQILDLVGATAKVGLASARDIAFISSHVTDDILSDVANEFRVPHAWLTGETQVLGDIGQSCPWRSPGGAADLTEKALTRTNGGQVTFYVVTPFETKDFMQLVGDRDLPSGRTEIPILIYSATQGEYGKVYEHYGIQPGELERYRKAACFLTAFIRKHAMESLTDHQLSCEWRQWPRERILDTASTLLLAAARRVVDSTFYQEAYDYAQPAPAGWTFPGQAKWDDDFNGFYAPTIEKRLCKLEFDKQAVFRKHVSSTNDLIALRLPPVPENAGRMFGAHAIELAGKYGMPVQVLRPGAAAPEPAKFGEAAVEFMELYERLHRDDDPTVFYIDVAPLQLKTDQP